MKDICPRTWTSSKNVVSLRSKTMYRKNYYGLHGLHVVVKSTVSPLLWVQSSSILNVNWWFLHQMIVKRCSPKHAGLMCHSASNYNFLLSIQWNYCQAKSKLTLGNISLLRGNIFRCSSPWDLNFWRQMDLNEVWKSLKRLRALVPVC